MGWFSTAMMVLFFLMMVLYFGTEGMSEGQRCMTSFGEYTQETYGTSDTPVLSASANFIWDQMINSWWSVLGGIVVVSVLLLQINPIVIAVYLLGSLSAFFLLPFSCLWEVLGYAPTMVQWVIGGSLLMLIVFVVYSALRGVEA